MLKISSFIVQDFSGYYLNPNRRERNSLVCIVEVALAVAYCIISINTFRKVEPPVLLLSFIWFIQMFISLCKENSDERHRIEELIESYGIDDSVKVHAPSNMRFFLFFGMLLLGAAIIAWNFSGAEAEVSVSAIRDIICIVVYIFALIEQIIEILIKFSGAVIGVPTKIVVK